MIYGCLLPAFAGSWILPAQEDPSVVFGTTVTSSSGLQGQVYLISPDSEELPNFKKLKPVGTVYTTSLRIAPRHFHHGFPGITNRNEWFAIDYKGRFWVEKPGKYGFQLITDDGKLYINDKLLIDNDGIHPAMSTDGSVELTRGVHHIRISYFQGPGHQLALILHVVQPGNDKWKYFDTNDFRPPPNEAEWTPGTMRALKRGSNHEGLRDLP